ncbi:MAG: hypothetical protein M5R40_06240 [Anaerolineae bacterium]|nr:hypothetical protein [Anaerolineae bacterium]
MSLFDILKSRVDQEAQKLLYFSIDPAHTDRALNAQPIQAGRHYFRLWLSEMFLRKKVQFFKQWRPAVHSLVKFDFGDQQVEIPNIADESKIGMQEQGQGDVVARNYVLTPLMPFNGGVVEIEAGLVAVQGANYLDTLIKVMGDFASLLAVPQLSSALSVAQPLANGLQALFGAGNSALQLGFHDAFVGGGAGAASPLQEGYIAVIRATEADVRKERLWVVKDELREGAGLSDGQHAPFQAFDHMLFFIEVREERDDWNQLTSIREPFQQAINALGDADETKADAFLRAAIVAALQSPELTKADRRRVVTVLKAEFDSVKADLGYAGLVAAPGPILETSMKRAMSVELALQMGEPTFEEVFGV